MRTSWIVSALLVTCLLGLNPSRAAAAHASAPAAAGSRVAAEPTAAYFAPGDEFPLPLCCPLGMDAIEWDTEPEADANTPEPERVGSDALLVARASTLDAPPSGSLEFAELPGAASCRLGTPPAQRPPRS